MLPVNRGAGGACAICTKQDVPAVAVCTIDSVDPTICFMGIQMHHIDSMFLFNVKINKL